MLGIAMLGAAPAMAFPGGTPADQRQSGIYCASCHASTAESDVSGVGDKARTELAENKHLSAIRAGIGVYGTLSEAERARLVELLAAVDRHSTVELEAPAQVAPGATFDLTVKVTGGAGPTVAVGLVDRPHRLFARSAWVSGWELVGAPRILGPKGAAKGALAVGRDGKERAPNFVDVEGIASDAEKDRWARARVVFTVKAPSKPGEYPLVAAYLYGTEKAVALSTRDEGPRFATMPLGGLTGASGRVKFSEKRVIRVGEPGSQPASKSTP